MKNVNTPRAARCVIRALVGSAYDAANELAGCHEHTDLEREFWREQRRIVESALRALPDRKLIALARELAASDEEFGAAVGV